MKIAIIGQGYVGLPIALHAARAGFDVIGFDIDKEVVKSLNSGFSHINDILNSDLLRLLETKKYMASFDPKVLQDVELIVIAVPTPLDAGRNPDLSFLDSACRMLGANLTQKTLIINESTSYPGTLRNFIANRIDSISKIKHLYAISPERVDPGNTSWSISNTPRLVSGLDPEATKKAISFYSHFCSEVVEVSSPEVAEAAKLFENTFRQVNIGLVNEFALISRSLGLSVREILDACATKPYGFMRFNPGLGVGGHCIPVDPTYLSFASEKVGAKTEFIDLANRINLNMPSKIIDLISKELKISWKSSRILVCGISYKSDISDIRESPSIELIKQLRSLGAHVDWYDPEVINWNGEKSVELPKIGYDLAILAIAHGKMNLPNVSKSADKLFDCIGKMPGEFSL